MTFGKLNPSHTFGAGPSRSPGHGRQGFSECHSPELLWYDTKYEGDWFSRLHYCLFFEEAGLEDNAAAVNLTVNLFWIFSQTYALDFSSTLDDH